MEEKKNMPVYFDRMLTFGFFCHDWVSTLILRHAFFIRRVLRIGACMVLLTFFFPAFAPFRRDFGEISLNLLIVILFLSPFAVIFRMRLLILLMGFRRELGVLMGCLALVHGLGYFISPHIFFGTDQSFFSIGVFSWEKGITTGLVGLLLIMPLLLTSNNLSLRFLGGKTWKRLHRLAYPAFFFIVLHQYLMGNSPFSPVALLGAFSLLGFYALMKFLAWRPEIFPWLQTNVRRISMRYQQYQRSLH